MKSVRYAIAGALLMTMGSAAVAQQAQTVRLRGTVENLDGNVVSIKLSDGASSKLTLSDNALIVGVVKGRCPSPWPRICSGKI